MGTLWQDIRYGIRMLAHNPGFTLTVVLILSLGIGVTTTMLSVVDAVLLRPPPYKDPDTLVSLYQARTDDETGQGSTTSYLNFVDWRDQSTVFQTVAGITNSSFRVATETRRERIFGYVVSPEYFDLLQVKPALGRVFLPEEAQPGSEPVVLISHRFWQDWFRGDAQVIGKNLVLDQRAYTVIGVLPPDFRYASLERQVWLPLVPLLHQWGTTQRSGAYMYAMARLRPGVTLTQAQAEMHLIGDRLARAYPDVNADKTVRVIPIAEEHARRVGRSQRALLTVQGIVAFVLLLACLHVAGLLLIRAAARHREIAVRAALGARRSRLMRQLLTEGVVLALLGGLFGLLLTHWGLGLVSTLRSAPSTWYAAKQMQKLIPWFVDLRVDIRTLFYVMAVSLLTCALFGILPALLASQTDLRQALSAVRTMGRGLRFQRIRSALVVMDIGLAFVLLAGAGLLINSYVRLNTGLGYQPDQVLTARIILDEGRPPYAQPGPRRAFFEQALARASRLPGVEAAAVADDHPAWGGGAFRRFRIDGFSPPQYSPAQQEKSPAIRWRQVSPDYFRTVQIPLSSGRFFTDRDQAGTSPVIVINQAMARRFWPGQNPVGRYVTEMRETRTQTGQKQTIPYEHQIVGVVGNARHFTAPQTGPPEPVAYVPYTQAYCYGDMRVMLRAHNDPRTLAKALRSELLAIDRNIQIRSLSALEDDIARYILPQRFNLVCLGTFAGAALALAAIGVYGITAYAVSQRSQEIGIHIALGAQSSDVLKAVVGQAGKLAAAGLALGLTGSFIATRVIRSLLYEISPTDPLTLACITLLLAGVALLASYLPARRAAKIDPMQALRYE